MPSAYQVAPVFLIRLAGVAFDELERLATPETNAAARELIVRQTEFAKSKDDVEDFLLSRRHNLTREQFRAWRKTTRSGASPPSDPSTGVFAVCFDSGSKLTIAQERFQAALEQELHLARKSLVHSAGTALPRYLVFAGDIRNAIGLAPELVQLRTKKERARERHLLLYLQRVCAKNDTLSEFGPSGWGTIDDGGPKIGFAPKPGIARRETFLERWTAHAAAAVLNADPEVRPELSPRIHPNGRLEGDRFIFAETGDSVSLNAGVLELLKRCDGKTPAHSLGIDLSTLEQLAEQNILRWEIEVPALEPHAFDALVADILAWRNTPVRAGWLDRLQPIADLPGRFATEQDIAERARIMDNAGASLEQLGAHRKTSSRFLYAAMNPIGEECFRECEFTISAEMINEVTNDAALWVDLWRDNYAFVASRMAVGLRGVFEKAGPHDGAIPLPAFLSFCETANLSLTGPGLVALATMAFQEVKAGFRDRMKPHLGKTEHQLTANECHFIRQQFEYQKFDEYTYPSADLQLAAKSTEAVAAGKYQWILAELHPHAALLHHGFYWAYQDKAAVIDAIGHALFGRPNFHFGFFAADFTATTAVHLFDLPRQLFNFVAPQRGNAHWRVLNPAETEVHIDETTGDVCLRKIDSREDLGSFTRSWITPLGFHPFSFSLGDSTPRLCCGNVVVQRRSWVVRQEELGPGDFTGVSRDLVLAVERIRAQRDLPRYVYIRPTEQVLRRSGAVGRDKDTKPVFIDLESYLFLEIFHRWLTKAGELEVIEMLPAPEDLLWREADGRRTFELRTLIVPRQ